MSVLTALDSKVWLFQVKRHSPLYSKVSVNIIREVCSYIRSQLMLPCISGTQFTLRDFESGEVKRSTLKVSFGNGAVFCLYRDYRILCAGDFPATQCVWSLDVQASELTREEPMLESRAWSGTIACKGFVYMFGGKHDPPLKSCEKFSLSSKHWVRMSDMHSAKTAFTPCLFNELIYLACPMPRAGNFEVFDLVTETFRELQVGKNTNSFGSVAFLVGETMNLVSYDGHLLSWQLESSEITSQPLAAINCLSAITNTLPCMKDGVVYWPNYNNGHLVSFKIGTKEVIDDSGD